MKSNWPDHTPEPGETPRWWAWGAVAAAFAAILVWSPGNTASWRWPAFALPEFTMPEFSMPQINLPDWGSDGAGDVSSQTAPITASVSELPSSLGQPMTEMPANLEMCQSTIAQAANAISQQPILIEDTSDRRVAVFKFIDGDLTVTCADGSMRMERRP